MSPEACKFVTRKKNSSGREDAADEISTKSDVFAFAMVIIYLITKNHPLLRLVPSRQEDEDTKRHRYRLIKMVSYTLFIKCT